MLRERANSMIAEMEENRKKDDAREQKLIQAAYDKDMAKAIENTNKVKRRARDRVLSDIKNAAKDEQLMVEKATLLKQKIGEIAQEVQRKKQELQAMHLNPRVLARKIKAVEDAAADEMDKLATAEDAEIEQLSAKLKADSGKEGGDANKALKWMAKEQNYIAKEEHFAESLWWKNHDELKAVEKQKIDEINYWLRKARVGVPMA